MPKELTCNIVGQLVEADDTISPSHRRRILEVLNAPDESPDDWTTERQAARMIDVSHSWLNRWRNRKITGPGPFPFTVKETAAGAIRYLIRSIDNYNRGKNA